MRTFPSKKFRHPARLTFLITLLLTVVLSACGYRGPLYLPDESPSESSTASTTAADPADPSDAETDEEEEG